MAVEVVPKFDLNTYQEKAGHFRRGDLPWREEVFMAALGLGGEAGEVLDTLKKVRYHGHEFDRERLKLELSDVLWYLADLCTLHSLELSEVAEANLLKLGSRYPDGFSERRSQNRG